MERPSFFRPADDMDLMDPLSEDETVISPPQGLAARSMALAAKKRGLGMAALSSGSKVGRQVMSGAGVCC